MPSAAEAPGGRPHGAAPAGPHWPGVRLHVVTGKGGTGKTTVAAALAVAIAWGGRRVLLCEVEGRQGIARLFDVPPLPYEERTVAVAPDGGEVFALPVDAEQALLEYLELFYKLGRAGKALRRMGAVDFATTVAPGLRDVLLTGKAYEAVRRRGPDGAPTYDAVVLDAPPTGRITRFLGVHAEVADLAKVGPIRGQADSIMEMLRSPQTAVHLVTLLEEMPVQETADAVQELTAAGLPVGGIVVNRARPPLLTDPTLEAAARGTLDREGIAAGLAASGAPSDPRVVDALLAEGRAHAERVALERAERRAVDALGPRAYTLPLLPDGGDLGGLYALAAALREQGAYS
ncbi:ArsA-related P-loop ATPase [Motilibacter aurantiacus]|uniref:ArsA-related P-loop ATPase n=1 Tax=Motilibacter aurantiacus TaxID=2714955 RepID=UPI001E2A3E92|nr:ArsA-related P-loop ATPase [Motilibacter aurantiacus]